MFSQRDFVIHPFSSSLSRMIEETQAITAAAELGHVFLHYPMVVSAHRKTDADPVVMAAPRHGFGNVQGRCDVEAMWFAQALLFPKAMFQALWDRHNGAVEAIATEQTVSQSLIIDRAKRLGLISDERQAA